MYVETELSVCVDCMQLIANDETPPDWTGEQTDKWLEQIANYFGPDQSGVSLGDSAKDDEFSIYACDFCGSTLAGERFHCIELKTEKIDL